MKKNSVLALLIVLAMSVFVWAEAPKNYLQNGDFELGGDGWDIQFSEWGEGEESASWGLSTEKDNVPNTTQKLSLYNGMKEDVEFTMTQTVSLAKGNYIASVIFEGGPTGLDPNATLSVNGKMQSFGKLTGWQKWKQVVLEGISGDTKVTIEIKGILTSKMWLAIDDIALVQKEEFTEKVFRRR